MKKVRALLLMILAAGFMAGSMSGAYAGGGTQAPPKDNHPEADYR